MNGEAKEKKMMIAEHSLPFVTRSTVVNLPDHSLKSNENSMKEFFSVWWGNWKMRNKQKLKSARELTNSDLNEKYSSTSSQSRLNGLTNVLPLNVWINYQINVASSRNAMMRNFILCVKTRSPLSFIHAINELEPAAAKCKNDQQRNWNREERWRH